MILKAPRMLIIDDNKADGIKIAESIWANGYAVRFIEYDPDSFIRVGKQNLKGVRIIFMDIDLIGDRLTGGSKIFTPVQTALMHCLDERNGPYVLITWSMHDSDAEELFEHLKERMPQGLKPILCKRLNKEDFTAGRTEDVDLSAKIKDYMKDLEAIGCLIEWEDSIQVAASETIQELVEIAVGIKGAPSIEALKFVLFSLAKAEGEKLLNTDNAVQHLHSILSQILYDQATNNLITPNLECGELICAGSAATCEGEWHNKVNAILHLDLTVKAPKTGHMPGDVFKYPELGHGLPIPDEDTGKFLRGNFMTFESKEEKELNKPEIEKSCKLLLVEITPPCDYSQNKFVWHRYIIAALIPSSLISLIWILNRKENKREESKLPEFLWLSPEFQKEELSPFRVVFNSRLIVSIPPKKEFQEKLGKRLFRIRQPLLSDMTGWQARQSTRLGHVSIIP